MEVRLYINNSEMNKIHKSLSNETPIFGTLRHESSITTPEILIKIDNPSGYNYAYIPDFGRYYFINDMTAVRNGLWRISMKVDALESFATQILSQNCIIDRSSKGYDLYLPDENLVTLVKTKTDIINFETGLLDSGEFILITAGG